MRLLHRFLAAVAVAGLMMGCVGGSKGLSAEDKARLKPYILDAAPASIPHKLDINYENKLHIIGYKVDPEVARPGTEVKLTYYWRCDDTLDDGWALFTHVHDDVADKSDNLDNIGPLRERKDDKPVLGPSRWERGKFYVDEQTYKVPDWVKGPELTFMVGVWKGNARLHIVSGPNDGDNRGIVVKLKTGLQPPAPPKPMHTEIPEVTVGKLAANDKITIDGKADEKAWGGAPVLGPFVDVGTGGPATALPVQGKVRLLWDDKNLYAFFEVRENHVVGGFDAKNKKTDYTVAGQPKLWTKDTVEMMADPDGDGDNKDYYELQISPQNKVFHSQYDDYNKPKTEPNGPFGHEDWNPHLKSAVVVHGKIDNAGDAGPDSATTGYDVEVAIPWAAYSKAKNHPPKEGDTWRMNFYAMKNNGGSGWSALLGQGNFHKAARFGKVHWGTSGASAVSTATGGHITDGGIPGVPHPHPGVHLLFDGGPRMHVATPIPGALRP